MPDRKALQRVEIKDADRGMFTAVIATFDRIDADGDVVRRSAFTEGEDVVVSAYGHQSWSGVLPVGHATIRTTSAEALADGQFLMSTTGGRETFEVVKSLAERGLGEWSWGFDVEAEERGTLDQQPVRFLNRVKTFEVSPVLRGAGVGTRTLAVKSGIGSPEETVTREYLRFVKSQLDEAVRLELADVRDRLELQHEMREIRNYGGWNG